MKPYTYLIIDLLTVSVCFAASFDRRIRFDLHFGTFFKAATIAAFPFILWDAFFAYKGIWWFNTEYTLGAQLLGLPVEEWLFFICIPFSCVFTYFCVEKFFNMNWAKGLNNLIAFATSVICAVMALTHPDKTYTLVTALTTLFTILYLHFCVKVEWLGKASLVYIVLMLGFFPVNGVLTGTGLDSPIVNYNPKSFLGIRMFSIPIEDAVYGYTQFMLNIYFFLLFKKQHLGKNEKENLEVRDRSKVVLVDLNDRAIGEMEKMEAHLSGKLHRAFSVFVLNSKDEMLLQQRAQGKYHGGGLWTNACCSHPQLGEDLLESAKERLLYEMGLECKLKKLFNFTYNTPVDNGLIEHEYDHVFLGCSDSTPSPNPGEVQNYTWVPISKLQEDILAYPERYTYWFRFALPSVLDMLQNKAYTARST